MDQPNGVSRTYWCRRDAEMAAVCLDQVRVMQRPRLMKTGGAAAAAEFELEQRNSGARRKKRG